MLKQTLAQDLARAEAVIANANNPKKKHHGPTADLFKGQALAYKRVLALLEMEQIAPNHPITLRRQYVLTIPWKTLAFVSACGILLLW